MLELKLRAEFEAVLKNYKTDQSAIDRLRESKLALMAGLTSSGRNTIIEELVETGRYLFLLSDTTRPRRIHHGKLEKDGGPYWFKTEEEVLQGLKQGKYFEAAIIHQQQVSGLATSEIERALSANKIAIKEVTPAGIDTYLNLKPDTICIFMLPPSFDVWLARQQKRGSMTPEELKRRQQSALEEIEHLLENQNKYQVLVNHVIAETADIAAKIIEEGYFNSDLQEKGLSVAHDIKAELMNVLS